MASLEEVQARLRAFNPARDWEQFHSPKNLAMALTGEVGELAALLQWLHPDDVDEWLKDADHHLAVRHEIADVLAYTLMLADAVGVDPLDAVISKIELNETRYPVEQFRASARKYDAL